jgi:hypothetical protein
MDGNPLGNRVVIVVRYRTENLNVGLFPRMRGDSDKAHTPNEPSVYDPLWMLNAEKCLAIWFLRHSCKEIDAAIGVGSNLQSRTLPLVSLQQSEFATAFTICLLPVAFLN